MHLLGLSPRRARRRLRLTTLEDRTVPADISAPVILQWFDGSYSTIEKRAADIFEAGYGDVYTPPPGRADSGDQSVGYDVYDRFDLGSAGHPTLYGTYTGLEAAINAIHRMGDNWTLDFVANHDGFEDLGTPGFAAAGGYPGLALTLNPGNNSQGYNDIDGDFHSAFATGDQDMRLAGLIDIAQEKNYQFVRSPVDPNDPRNLPAGTTPLNGRLANVPDPNNRRFYPDQGLQPIYVFDPTTGEQNIPIYPFNTANPLNGTPVRENATGYLMRYAQWLVQVVGADSLRMDAAKNYPNWVLNYIDRAVYRQDPRLNLDGSQPNPFLFSEVFDGDKGLLQTYIRKDINPSDPGTVGGNRDVLDFPLFFALQGNLSNNGLQNDWNNVLNASQDSQDDGLANNGSEGVSFVSSHDNFGPYLSNVAYAFTLMRPGNAIVYFNGHEFGNRDFPKDGRGDALGGLYGNLITTLVNIRNTHGRGNFIPRDVEKETLIFERDNSAIVALSNRLDSGYDSRTVQTDFTPGTPLIELTGNASDPAVDPFDDIPSLVVVNGDGTVNLRVPRNTNANGVEDDRGYVIYGVSGPQGNLSISGVDHVIPAQTPTANTNGTARLSPIDVITGDSFQVRLDTNAVNLLGSFRDHDADGDNALIRIDGGIDVNGNGQVDNVTPGSVAYGFENFTTEHNPGYFSADGNGDYVQTIDTTRLSEGIHYITVRAFRHRSDGGPPVYTDFRQAFYVDRLPADSRVASFDPIASGVNENLRAVIRSVDETADNVHVFLDLPAGLTDAQVIAMVGLQSQATQIDRDLWTKDFTGLTSGNHVLTVVTFEISGRATVERVPGWFVSTMFGAGLGDLNFDGRYGPADVSAFVAVLNSDDGQFNPAADLNGDGRIDNTDLVLLHDRLLSVHADWSTLAAYQAVLGPAAGLYTTVEGGGLTLAANHSAGWGPALGLGWDTDLNGSIDLAADTPLTWATLEAVGVNDNGIRTIGLRVTAGSARTLFTSRLAVRNTPPSADGLTTDGPKYERQVVTISLVNPTDPSSADRAASLRYWFDLDGNGRFTDPGDVRHSASPTVRRLFTKSGTYTLHAMIRDKDGGFSPTYRTTATIRNADFVTAGTGPGVPAQVRSLDAVSGAVRFTVTPFGPGYTSGVVVATGDVNGDGVRDVVVGTAGGGLTAVKVFDGITGVEITSLGFGAFPASGADGVSVAVGDVNNDGYADLMVGSGPGTITQVRIVSGKDGSSLGQFFPIPGSTVGVRVAAGDVTGDHRADIIVTPMTGPPTVRVFSGAGSGLVRTVQPVAGATGGAFVAAGDLDGDGFADIVTSYTVGTTAHVRVYDGRTGAVRQDFVPFAGSTVPRVAVLDLDDDGRADLLVGSGPGSGRVKGYRGPALTPLGQWVPFGPDFTAGLFVA